MGDGQYLHAVIDNDIDHANGEREKGQGTNIGRYFDAIPLRVQTNACNGAPHLGNKLHTKTTTPALVMLNLFAILMP